MNPNDGTKREIVTVQELDFSNMLELETLRQLPFEKGINKDEFVAKFKKLDRKMKKRKGEQKELLDSFKAAVGRLPKHNPIAS